GRRPWPRSRRRPTAASGCRRRRRSSTPSRRRGCCSGAWTSRASGAPAAGPAGIGFARVGAGVARSPAVAWVLDLDGVIWLADQPMAGAAEAVARLRDGGERVLFVTNTSYAPVGEQEAKLERFGIPARGDVVNSAMAAATLVAPGERALVCGGPGVVEAV